MSDDQQGPDAPQSPEVGSVGEEAAKLFGALSGWAREQDRDPGHGLADSLGDLVGNVNEHLATGGEDCRYCPVCQLIHAVRETNPEVRQQLSVAASSLLRAAAALLATEPSSGTSGVEKIDLSDDAPWDE